VSFDFGMGYGMSAATIPIRMNDEARSMGPDAVRALASLLVVYLHACVPYLVHPMPHLVWPVSDASSLACDRLFWAIEIFIMPLFLVISGFFAFRACKNSDGFDFLKTRARRLLCPLLFGMVVILPIDLYIWVLGLIAEGHMPISKLRSLKIPPPFGDHIWGLSHLWFLLYAFLYAVVMAAVARYVLPRGVPLRWRPTLRKASIWILGMIGIASLVWAPQVVFDFQHAALPVPSKWLYSGTFFAGGVALAAFDPQFRVVNRLSTRHLVLGAIATFAAVALGCWSLRLNSEPTNLATNPGFARITLASITVLAAWTVTLGTIGVANRMASRIYQFPRVSQSIKYLANASFWIYLVHHPVLGIVHIDLKWLAPSMDPFLKSIVSTTIALTWATMSYHWMIRTTWFGRWIGVTSRATTPDAGIPMSNDQQPKLPDSNTHTIRIAA
jgi:glucans biosynthesis protein C